MEWRGSRFDYPCQLAHLMEQFGLEIPALICMELVGQSKLGKEPIILAR